MSGGYRVDDRPPLYKSERRRDWLMVLAIAIVAIVLYQFTTWEKAITTAGTLCVLYALVTVMWDYRRERWFWITIVIIGLVHFVVIALTTFTFPSGPALSYVFPAMLVDCLAMLGVLKWLASKLSPTNSHRT